MAKPALPVLNEPLAGYALGRLAEAGVREVAVNLHHLGATIRAALGDGSRWGLVIRYVEEPTILGTGGAVRNLREWLAGQGTCLVANADTVTDVDLSKALVDHRVSLAQATLVAQDFDPRPAFSAVWRNAKGSLMGFGTQSPKPEALPAHFAGFHFLEPDFLNSLPATEAFCLHRDGYVPFLAAGGRARVWTGASAVHDAGTLERYLDVQTALLADPLRAGKLRGRPLPPARAPGVFVDAGCGLAGDAVLEPPVLLESCSVAAGSRLGPGVVAGAGSRVEAKVHLSRAVLMPGSSVPSGFAGDVFVALPRKEEAA